MTESGMKITQILETGLCLLITVHEYPTSVTHNTLSYPTCCCTLYNAKAKTVVRAVLSSNACLLKHAAKFWKHNECGP